MKPGSFGVVRDFHASEDDQAMLQAMGLRVDALVRVCRTGEPCIVEVLFGGERCGGCSCRIGLARPLAESVMVEAAAIDTRPMAGCV